MIALVLGGGGSPAPRPELILELLAAGFVLLCLIVQPAGLDWQRVPRTAWIIAGLVTIIPLVQLIPLPPFIWHALPARELEVKALALIGAENSWRTWSLAPSRTLASLLSLAPPLLMLIMASMLGRSGRNWLIRSIALIGLATLVVGTLQITGGDASPAHFYGATEVRLDGFQANPNSTADLLLIAMMTVPVLLRDLTERRLPTANRGLILASAGAAIALLAFGVVLTASRTGIMLLPVPVFASLWIMRPWLNLSGCTLIYGSIGTLALAAIGLFLLRNNPVLATVAARFDFTDELRPQLWQDGFYVAKKYFPFGVGMGDFVPALIADERLETIWPSLPNRAHNDFLELACEAGIAGLLALSAIALMLSRALWQKLRGRGHQSVILAVFAGAGLAILSLHSLVDYPFRSMALACLGAVCAGLILAPRPDGGQASDAPDPGKTR